jgi:hypothetical protein
MSKGRKAIEVQGRGWSTNDIFRDFFVVNEVIYKKTSSYDILHANETSLEDFQQGKKACFVLLKVKGKVKLNLELNCIELYLSIMVLQGMKIAFRKKIGAELDDLNGNKAICAAISAVCFALLLAAFVITKETKFIQGKSIFCHSFCMMVTFICLFINFMSFVTSGSALCYITGECGDIIWYMYFF